MCCRSLKFDIEREEETEENKRGTALSVSPVSLCRLLRIHRMQRLHVVRVRSGRGGGRKRCAANRRKQERYMFSTFNQVCNCNLIYSLFQVRIAALTYACQW